MAEGYVLSVLSESESLLLTGQPSRPSPVAKAMEVCDTLITGRQVILHGNPHEQEISQAAGRIRQHYLPGQEFERAMVLKGTLGKSLTIPETDVEGHAWVVMWQSHRGSLGVRVLPVSKINVQDRSFDPTAWTIVVFWQEKTESEKPVKHMSRLCGHQNQILVFRLSHLVRTNLLEMMTT